MGGRRGKVAGSNWRSSGCNTRSRKSSRVHCETSAKTPSSCPGNTSRLPWKSQWTTNTLFILSCLFYPVHGTLFIVPHLWHLGLCAFVVHSTMFIPCSWYPAHSTLFPAPCSWYPVHCTVFMVPCLLHQVHCTVFISLAETSTNPDGNRHASPCWF